MYTLVIPVYRNEASIPELLLALNGVDEKLDRKLEVVFVVDGSPDRSREVLESYLPGCTFRSKLVLLSRNFGSFPAIRAGLAEGRGPYFAVMSADLQEPVDLVQDLFRALETEPVHVAVGVRTQRADPPLTRWSAQAFWFLYRRLVQPEIPRGGVDTFACTQEVRDRLLELEETNTSLVGQLFWIGFERKLIPYERRPRPYGHSAWTWRKKLRYLSDSIFAFSDFPIHLLIAIGAIGMVVSPVLALVVLIARLQGLITVPGYAATVLTVIFFGTLNLFALGIIGAYVWRAFENTKRRPEAIVMSREEYEGKE